MTFWSYFTHFSITFILFEQRFFMTQAKKSVSGFSPNSKKARTISAMSLTGKPICKLVPPGECQFTEEWSSCKLLERVEVSETSSLLRFDLPKKDEPLNLSTCACILAKADLKNREGEDEAVIRPYTPVSTNDLKGCFDLLVKVCSCCDVSFSKFVSRVKLTLISK